ncbi:MAG: response regulator [Candidatus Altiarchaeota archaeon]
MDKKILLVDDDPAIRHSLGRILDSKGYAVELAENGQDCLDKLNGHGNEFKLIILDIMMPGLSGGEVTKALMKDKLLKHIPIIYLMAKTDEPSRVAGYLGGEEYITKPFNTEDLLERIRQVLARVGGEK